MGGNLRKKSIPETSKKSATKSARGAAKATRSATAVTPKAFRTDVPLRPDRLAPGPRRELRLPVAAATDRPVRPVDVTRSGWTEKRPPKPEKA